MDSNLRTSLDELTISPKSEGLTADLTQTQGKESLLHKLIVGENAGEDMASSQCVLPPPDRNCSGCGQTEESVRFKTCAKCQVAVYCSRECQAKHWITHKKQCHKPNGRSTSTPQSATSGMDSPWNEKLYKPTTPYSIFNLESTPEKIKEYSQAVVKYTQRISSDSQNPQHWLDRAETLTRLRFADLAAGDAYKACELLVSKLSLLLRGHGPNYGDLSALSPELKAIADQDATLLVCSYIWLSRILVDSRDKFAARSTIQEGRRRFPSQFELQRDEKDLDTTMKQDEEMRQLTSNTFDPSAFSNNPRFGAVVYIAYPFIPEKYLGRSNELIQAIKEQIESEAEALLLRSVTLSSSTVQDQNESKNGGAPTALGVFATCDLVKGAPLLIDTPALAATELGTLRSKTIIVCDNCCGTIPVRSRQKCSASCCTVQYCSRKCRDLALDTYHQVLCRKDFDWVWEDSKTGFSDYDLDGPMWLRILATCVQSNTHPLEHPLLARLTPMYDENSYRRWTLSNNIIIPNKILRQLGVDIYADSRFDTWVLQTLWVRNLTNVHEVRKPKVGGRVRAINPYFSFLNHSCEPNADYSSSIMLPCKEGGQKYIYATRAIKKGEEITISYRSFSEKETKEERRIKLMPWIGQEGHCSCPRCMRES